MAPTRPPEVVACPDCTPGVRCEEHKVGLMGGGVPPQRLRCPGCGGELPMPGKPAPGCKPSCPRYGRRVPGEPPIPFVPAPLPPASRPPPMRGASGHERMRAWERLERACSVWLQTRDVAVRGTASPLAIRKIESEMEDAARALARLRKEPNR